MSLDHSSRLIHVVAGVVIDANERVLIAQRPAGKHLAGGWEFPGGKLEPGEEPSAGLARELKEEIGIAIRQPRPLIRLRHTYPYGEVLLDVWVVRRYSGAPQSLDGQALRWLSRAALPRADLLPADRPIIAALRLPERLRRTATRHYAICRLGDLSSARSPHAEGEPVIRPSRLLGVQCRSAAQGTAAATAGADFLVLREALPDGELTALCRAVAVPVFARSLSLERAWGLGASGINAIVC